MNFNKHLEYKNTHAIFGASQSAWLRYSPEKMDEKYRSQYRTSLGTEIHGYAAAQIRLAHKQTNAKSVVQGLENYLFVRYFDDQLDDTSSYAKKLIKAIDYLPREALETTKAYINDAIGYRLTPEQPLVYSDLFYGTTDTIGFKNNFLRIHDLKSGDGPTHMEQLEGYAALFCLEYDIKLSDIEMELRIYQADNVLVANPTAEDIVPIMDKIITDNKRIKLMESEEI